ncbi:hypothetical protein [Streptomyces sp. NPDC059893]|uniref:hypothetical protein n=1 Tax=Streptomyces sp. NPDC059893 TaxID=3346990 RepID=UPI00365F59A5
MENIGNRIIEPIMTTCRSCLRTVTFPPGTLSADRTKELRTCPDCGAVWEADAWFVSTRADNERPDM